VYTPIRGSQMRYAFAIALAASLVLTGCRCGGSEKRDAPAGPATGDAAALDPATLPDEMVTCPVCGLEFNAKEAVAARAYGGRTYYFLLEDHAEAFAQNPKAYLKK
jgi:YHS domain-containing protein